MSDTSRAAQAVTVTPDKAQVLRNNLGNVAGQSTASSFQPSVGTPVPPDMKLQPMPPAVAQAMPEVKDHQVAKTDDDVILIVDPVTRQVVGVIEEEDGDPQ